MNLISIHDDINVKFAKNGVQFTGDLFQQLSKSNSGENIIFSPFSVQCCLALAFVGAEGETAEELVKGLYLVSSNTDDVAKTFQFVLQHYKNCELLTIANKVYVQDSLKLTTNYADYITKCFDAGTEHVNFSNNDAAANTINNWISEATHKKIEKLISADSLGPLTSLVLLNAMHFKGQWEQKFNAEFTEEGEFYVDEENTIKVQYMNQKAKFYHAYCDELACHTLEMPYANSDLKMFILLPNEHDGLKDLLLKLKTYKLHKLASQLKKDEIIVKLPKFKAEYTVELTETLQNLGINRIFYAGAEFNKMLESPSEIHVSKVLHKAAIEVNEEGTEAAAATGVIMMMRALLIETEFVADHPFLYVIWNRKNIMFAGCFVNAPIE